MVYNMELCLKRSLVPKDFPGHLVDVLGLHYTPSVCGVCVLQ